MSVSKACIVRQPLWSRDTPPSRSNGEIEYREFVTRLLGKMDDSTRGAGGYVGNSGKHVQLKSEADAKAQRLKYIQTPVEAPKLSSENRQ